MGYPGLTTFQHQDKVNKGRFRKWIMILAYSHSYTSLFWQSEYLSVGLPHIS
jgi:hypothetical protein